MRALLGTAGCGLAVWRGSLGGWRDGARIVLVCDRCDVLVAVSCLSVVVWVV
jgi:hypothetical protein